MSIPVFINDRAIRVAPGTTLGQALAEHEPELFAALLAGRLLLTDGRSIPADADLPVHAGSIFRARESARMGGAADA
jgi:hypothetical protein